jgi:ComF family protein
MIKILISFLDFLFPPACPLCGAGIPDQGAICADCWKKFEWISDPKCDCCGYPFPANAGLGPKPLCPICASRKNELDWLRSACVYNEASKNVILPFKHTSALKFAKIMSNSMIVALHEIPEKPDMILPVPLAWQRLFKRGYNQATVLGRPIAKHFGVKLNITGIKRKYRPDMGHKNARQRHENIRGVFKVQNPRTFKDKTILIVDDVMTTGATFAELRRVLKRAGAKRVMGVSFARVVKAI